MALSSCVCSSGGAGRGEIYGGCKGGGSSRSPPWRRTSFMHPMSANELNIL